MQQQPTSNTNQPNTFNQDTASTILACIIHAHVINTANPGSYNTEVNKLFKANNLPQVKFPDNPPSKDIMSLAKATEKSEEIEEMELAEETEQRPLEEQESAEEEEREEMPDLEKLRGKEVGLNIITKKSIGWPSNINLANITEGINTGKYKWTYEDEGYDEDEILRGLKNDEIEFKGCWKTMEDTQFKKVRNGLITERTPPPRNTTKSSHKTKK